MWDPNLKIFWLFTGCFLVLPLDTKINSAEKEKMLNTNKATNTIFNAE